MADRSETTGVDSDDSDISNEADRAFGELLTNDNIIKATEPETDEFEDNFGDDSHEWIKGKRASKKTSGDEARVSSLIPHGCDNPVSLMEECPLRDEAKSVEKDKHSDGDREISSPSRQPMAASLEIMASKSGNPTLDNHAGIERVASALSNGSHVSTSSSDKGWMSDPENIVKRKQQNSYQHAKDEWEQVETVTADGSLQHLKSPVVSYEEAIFHFSSVNLDEFSAHIKPVNHRSGIALLWHKLTGPPKLKPELIEKRNLIFTLGHCAFDNHDPMHLLILQTIYKRLTATTLDCSRYGPHWIEIGFQGEDPATDLRGCGMLGLVSLLYFVSNERTVSLALETYRLAQDETQNFPFCVLGINITRIALQALRSEKLNRECNIQGDVGTVFHELYTAIFHQFLHVWKTQHKTIKDSGFVLQELENQAKSKPLVLMKEHKEKLSKKSKPIGKSKDHTKEDKINSFSGICDMNNDDIDENDEDIHVV